MIDQFAPASSSALFQTLFESSPDGLLLVASDGRISLANDASATIFGRSPDELSGSSVEELVPEDARAAHVHHRAGFSAHPSPRAMGSGLTLFARHADGGLFPVEVSLSPIDVDGEPMTLAAVRDVTEIQANRSSLALSQERERIARDIHDMVIQRIFAAGMSLQSALPMVVSPGVRDRIRTVTDDLDDTIRELRSAIFRLGVFDEHRSFGRQLRDAVAERTELLGFEPSLLVDSDLGDLPDHVAEQVLATVTEALSNVARHADASGATVELRRRSGRLHLTITDDGKGIVASPKTNGGLANMMWRAAELGGHCSVRANEPSGTHLSWQVPV